MRFLRLGGLAICIAAGLATYVPAGAANLVLITADEAKLPPPKGAIPVSARGVTRGPKVELVSQSAVIRSPAKLQLKFQTFGGAKVDLDAVQATYLRTPNVDLTPRIKPFVSADRHRCAGGRTAARRAYAFASTSRTPTAVRQRQASS